MDFLVHCQNKEGKTKAPHRKKKKNHISLELKINRNLEIQGKKITILDQAITKKVSQIIQILSKILFLQN